MQSTTGIIECVVCSSTESGNPSPTRGFVDGMYFDQESKQGEYRENERFSASNPRTISESIDRESTEYGNPLIHSSGNGLRYLAIPENLDINDHEALLSFLTESKRKQRASTEKVGTDDQDISNHHQGLFHKDRNARGPQNANPPINADSDPTAENSKITKMTNLTNMSLAQSHGNEISLSTPTGSLQVFDLSARQSHIKIREKLEEKHYGFR
jgi:hypothetical protein